MKKEVVYLGIAASILALALASTAAAQVCKGVGSGYSQLKMPFFGDLHSHTSWSFDAVTIGTATTPVDAYNFAKGERIPLASWDPDENRSRQLDRPLDFLAVTDHSEYLGEVRMCLPCGAEARPGTPGCTEEYPMAPACASMQNTVFGLRPTSPLGPLVSDDYEGFAFLIWGVPVVLPDPQRFPFCRNEPVDCSTAIASVWGEVQANANKANAPCEFTAFIGYEWSSQPMGRNHHRNVIFKNADVPPTAFSVFETQGAGYNLTGANPSMPADGAPELWRLLDKHCVSAGGDCDALAIPHNANFGGGTILPVLDDPEQREWQLRFERLMEIHQTKGNSECRTGVGTTDEDCQFELMTKLFLLEVGDMGRARGPVDYASSGYLSAEDQGYVTPGEPFGANLETPTGGTYNSFQREILKAGLWLAHSSQSTYGGENPHKVGVVAATDTHASTAGATEEIGYEGQHNLEDASPELRLSLAYTAGDKEFDADPKHTFLEMNPGGLTAVWATENTRDAIFDSMKNRETYGTSGTRPSVRFFGSWTGSAGEYDSGLCDRSADVFAEAGYKTDGNGAVLSVPMGSTLPSPPNAAAKPIFAIRATSDPRTDLAGNLQRLQVIKGWIDEGGNPQESVTTVAHDGISTTLTETEIANYVDTATCETDESKGKGELCVIWEDPAFKAGQDAFYYVRVLETPTCRWSTRQCLELDRLDGTADPHPCWESIATPGVANDGGKPDGVTVPLAIQERAWSSPIWYESGP